MQAGSNPAPRTERRERMNLLKKVCNLFKKKQKPEYKPSYNPWNEDEETLANIEARNFHEDCGDR